MVDISGSVAGYKDDLEKAIKTVVEACKHSPRVDNLMLRIVLFNHVLDELHGFKLFGMINIGDYDGCLNPMGTTALVDATFTGLEATAAYGKDLIDNDFAANAIVVVVTDGWDNSSVHDATHIEQLIKDIHKAETLESLKTILIGVGTDEEDTVNKLEEFQAVAGFDQFEKVEDATPESLAKVADFISRSVSSASQSLGTGGPSQNLTF